MMPTRCLAVLAIIPMAMGTTPEAQRPSTLMAKLCNGGTLEIPLGGGDEPDIPCTAKACHAGSCRKRFDQGQ